MQFYFARLTIAFVMMFSVSAFAKKQPATKVPVVAGGGTKIFVPSAEAIKKMKPEELQAYVSNVRALVVEMEQKLYKGKYQASLEEKKQWGLIFNIWSQANAADAGGSNKCLFGGRPSQTVTVGGKTFCKRPSDSACDLGGSKTGYKCGAIFGDICVPHAGNYDDVSVNCNGSAKAFEVTADNIETLRETATATQGIYDTYCAGTMSSSKTRDCGIWKSRIDAANAAVAAYVPPQPSPQPSPVPTPQPSPEASPVPTPSPVVEQNKCKDKYAFVMRKGGEWGSDGLDDKTGDVYEDTNCILCGFQFVCGKLEGQYLPEHKLSLRGGKLFDGVDNKGAKKVDTAGACQAANQQILEQYNKCPKGNRSKSLDAWKRVYVDKKIGDKKWNAKEIAGCVNDLYSLGKGYYCATGPHKLGDLHVTLEDGSKAMYASENEYRDNHFNPVLLLPNFKTWRERTSTGSYSEVRTTDKYEKDMAEALGFKVNENKFTFTMPKDACKLTEDAAQLPGGVPAMVNDGAQSETGP